jgi:NADPH:quinone reductase-like Zn-dependent oxidoreductase
VDVVVDHVGAQFFEAAFNSLNRSGRYGNCGVTTGYQVQLQMGTLFTQELRLIGVYMGSKEDMRQIVAMLNQGKLKPVVHQTFPLEEATQAHQAMEDRNFFGKLVLTV